MRPILLIALASPALLALQQAPGDVALANASAADIEAAVAAAGGNGMRPGAWEVRREVLDATPGGPEAQPQVQRSCVTPRDATRAMGLEGDGPPECRYRRYTLAGGRLESLRVCDARVATTTSRWTGTIGPEDFVLDHDGGTVTKPPEPPRAVGMHLRYTGHRLGDCVKAGK